MGDGTATREFVDLTVHDPTGHAPPPDPRIRAGYRPMQPQTKPPPTKTYPRGDRVPVPDELSDVLHWSAGVVRTLGPTPFGTLYFRAAGSAGNLHPLEIYIVSDGTVAWYDPLGHGLVPIADGVSSGPTTLVITGVPWRTAWKYRERGFRHLYWDCGTMLSHLLALAPSARVWMGFDDRDVASLVGADGTHELPLALVTLGDGPPVTTPPPGEVGEGRIADHPFEFPLITATQHAGDLTGTAVDTWRATSEPLPSTELPIDDVVGVIRRRGSTRQFDRARTGPPGLLYDAFAAATAPLPADFVEPGATLLSHHVIVHGIEGTEPGAYRWTGDGFEQLAAADLRAEAAALCLHQELAASSCYTAFHGTDLDAVLERLGDRGYRAALLEAGVVEGRLHLAAFDLGYGATGLTYFDRAVQEQFGTSDTPLLVTAVGPPATRSPLAGPPGQPIEMRPPGQQVEMRRR